MRSQLQRENGKLTFCAPKTRRSRRQIALAQPAAEALKRHEFVKRSNVSDRNLPGTTTISCSPLASALRFQRRMSSPGFKTLLEKGALPDVRFHDLRHTRATLLLGARVNPKVVSEMLGHASVAITLDIYSHVLPNMQQDAAAAMGELLIG